MKQSLAEHERLTKALNQEYDRLKEERNSINAELNDLFAEKAEKDIVIKTLTNENLELNGRINALEQLLCVKEDIQGKIDMLMDVIKKCEANKDKYKGDLETCTNYLLEVEEKC